MWNKEKRSSIPIIGVSEWEEKENEANTIFKIKWPKFPKTDERHRYRDSRNSAKHKFNT